MLATDGKVLSRLPEKQMLAIVLQDRKKKQKKKTDGKHSIEKSMLVNFVLLTQILTVPQWFQIQYFWINKRKLLKKSLGIESIVSSFKTKAKEIIKIKFDEMKGWKFFLSQSYKVWKVDKKFFVDMFSLSFIK